MYPQHFNQRFERKMLFAFVRSMIFRWRFWNGMCWVRRRLCKIRQIAVIIARQLFYWDSEESTGTWFFLSGRRNKCIRWCRRQTGNESAAGTESVITLRICGITKPVLRDESEKHGLFTARKPAYACLATRIPSGTRITAKQLQDVEQAETALAAMGFTDFRVRHPEGYAKLQVKPEQLSLVMEKREEILTVLEPIFGTVCLDLKTR